MKKEDFYESKKQLIDQCRERLNWYRYEATAEEFDDKEVQTLMDFLRAMDPVNEEHTDVQKSMVSFQKSMDLRDRIEKEFERLKAGESTLADYPDPDCPDENDEEAIRALIAEVNEPIRKNVVKPKPAKKIFRFKTKGFTKVVAAASLVVALFVGGTVGAYAQKEGVFTKIIDSEDKSFVAANPSTDSNSEGYQEFESIEKLPMKYLNYLWTPTDIPNNIEIYSIELFENELYIRIICEYIDQETKQFVNTTKKTFKDKIVITDLKYDGFDFCCKEQYGSVKVQYFVKENQDYTEYIALFENENSVYSLHSNCDFEVIKSMIKENVSNNTL